MTHHQNPNHNRRVPTMPGSFGVERPVQRATTPAELAAMQQSLQGNPAHARMVQAMTGNPAQPRRAIARRGQASGGPKQLQGKMDPRSSCPPGWHYDPKSGFCEPSTGAGSGGGGGGGGGGTGGPGATHRLHRDWCQDWPDFCPSPELYLGNPAQPRRAIARRGPRRAMPQRGQSGAGSTKLKPSPEPGYQLYLIPGPGKKGKFIVALKQFGYSPATFEVDYERVAGNKARILQTTGPAAAWKGTIVPIKMAGNPAGRPSPTLPGTFANSQMPVAASSQHRGVNIKAQGIAQDEAEAVARRPNPRLPSMAGTFANSQMPIAASAMLRGPNIQAQGQAQAAAVAVTHSAREGNPGCKSCADAGRSARMSHRMIMSRRMPMGANPTTRVPSMPGAYGLPMLGLGDRRGMPALQDNPDERAMWDTSNGFAPRARFQRALAQAARQRYAVNPEGDFGPLKRFQIALDRAENPKHKAIHTAKARMRQQNPGCGGDTPIRCASGKCVDTVTKCDATSVMQSPTVRGKLARQARMAQSVRAARGDTQGAAQAKKAKSLLQSCPPGYYFAFGYGCLPYPKKGNPAPSRASSGTSDVTYGVYDPTGSEVFIPDANAAKAKGKELSAQHGGVQVKIREYRGDGRGGWVAGSVFGTKAMNPSIAAKTKAKIHRDIARARAGNPGCSACHSKMRMAGMR